MLIAGFCKTYNMVDTSDKNKYMYSVEFVINSWVET